MNTQPAIETASAQPENVRNPKGRPMLNSGEVDKVLIELEQVTAQRDELLKALKGMVDAFAPHWERTVTGSVNGYGALQSDVCRAVTAIRNAEQQH